MIDQLKIGERLQRKDLERRFSIHMRTAKRDLSELVQEGLIEFQGQQIDGYYRVAAMP